MAPAFTLDLDVDELETATARDPLGNAPDNIPGSLLPQAVSLQKKEWGEPTLVHHPELER